MQEYVDATALNDYLSENDLSGQSPDYKVRIGFDSPALRYADPSVDFYKELRISFVSLDQQWVVLGGSVHPDIKPGVKGCDFAFAASPKSATQEVEVLAGDPGTMRALEELIAQSLNHSRQ